MEPHNNVNPYDIEIGNDFSIKNYFYFCSIHPHPYSVSPSGRRHHRSMKGKSTQPNHQSYVQIEELPDDYDEGATSNAQRK